MIQAIFLKYEKYLDTIEWSVKLKCGEPQLDFYTVGKRYNHSQKRRKYRRLQTKFALKMANRAMHSESTIHLITS